MNIDDEYCIPENIEDEFLRSVAFMAIEALKEKYILKDILKKYIVDYNGCLKERCSSRSLQVMNENHKLVFSTITSSGVKKKPSLYTFSAKRDIESPCFLNNQILTPLKKNITGLNRERKRLTFDVEKNEYKKPVNAITKIPNEDKIHLDAIPSFSNYEEFNFYDNPTVKYNLDGMPESLDNLSIYDETALNLSTEGSDKYQMMFITPEKKNRISPNYIIKQSMISSYVESLQSYFSNELSDSESSDMYKQKRFNLEKKPETITSLDSYDHDDAYTLTKTPDSYPRMLNRSENENSTLENYATDAKKSVRYLSFSPTTSLKEVNKQNINKSFSPDKTYESPEKFEALNVDANKEERIYINQTAAEDCLPPIKAVEASIKLKIKRPKSVEYSEALLTTSCISEDQELIVSSKTFEKNNGLTIDDEKTTISTDSFIQNDSICSTDDLPMDFKNNFKSTDNFAMDCNDSFNSEEDYFIVDHDVSQTDGISFMSVFRFKDNYEKMYVSPAKNSENQTYPISPEDRKNTEFEIKSDIRNLKYGKIRISEHEKKDIESLKYHVQKLSPSVKPFSGDIYKKSMSNKHVADDSTITEKLRLRDNTKLDTSPPERIISDEQSAKPDDSFDIQMEKFIEMLKQRKSRFTMFLNLFLEDQNDLRILYTFNEKLYDVVRELVCHNNDLALIKAVVDFGHKTTGLKNKSMFWMSNMVRDIETWNDCLQKIDKVLQDTKQFCAEKKHTTLKDFQKMEACFRIVNKKADDMTLLREVRRPSIIQFVYQLENATNLFIENMLALGILKLSSKVSSN